jgi:hypothetical protein
MAFTIRIEKTENKLAKNLLTYLQSLTQTKEYDFLQIIEEEECILSEEQKNEFDLRYSHFLQHHDEYPDWEDVKHKFLQQ